MFDATTRIAKERLLEPLAAHLGAIHPTIMTVISLAAGLAAAYFAWQGSYGLALLCWGVNRITDGLDGTMARIQGQQSDLGGYLDILVDYLIYALLPISLVLAAPNEGKFTALVFLLATYYVNSASWMYLAGILEKRASGARARGELTTITMPAGLIEGTETIAFYTLFLLFPGYLSGLFYLFGGLVIITIGQRLLWAWRELA